MLKGLSEVSHHGRTAWIGDDNVQREVTSGLGRQLHVLSYHGRHTSAAVLAGERNHCQFHIE